MAISDPFTLPADVVVMPVADLDPMVRAQVTHEPGDYCVTRPLTRTVSVIVDAHTARLLECFRRPTTIVDAVVAFSAAEGADARETLDSAFDVLGDFVGQGLLLPADSELATPWLSSSLAWVPDHGCKLRSRTRSPSSNASTAG
jgi:serine/threonine-protein kinase